MSGNPITEHMFPLCSIRYILNFHITHLPCRHSYHPLPPFHLPLHQFSHHNPPIPLEYSDNLIYPIFYATCTKIFVPKTLKILSFLLDFKAKSMFIKLQITNKNYQKTLNLARFSLISSEKKVISRNLIDFTTRHLKITLLLPVSNIIFNSNIQLKLTNNSPIKLPSGHHYFTLHPFILH